MSRSIEAFKYFLQYELFWQKFVSNIISVGQKHSSMNYLSSFVYWLYNIELKIWHFGVEKYNFPERWYRIQIKIAQVASVTPNVASVTSLVHH